MIHARVPAEQQRQDREHRRSDAGSVVDTSVFSLPAPFTYRTTGRILPDVRKAGVKNLDFSPIKDTRLYETTKLEFRAEVFNLLNTPQFASPGTTLGSATFGVVRSQANQPRELQLALKLLF